MSSRLAAYSYYLTGVTVDGCNGVMNRQFPCLWTASAQREDGKHYRHASFDTTWPLSFAPQKWMVRMIRTTMAVNIVNIPPTLSGMAVNQHTVRAQLELEKKKKKVISLVVD